MNEDGYGGEDEGEVWWSPLAAEPYDDRSCWIAWPKLPCGGEHNRSVVSLSQARASLLSLASSSSCCCRLRLSCRLLKVSYLLWMVMSFC